MSYILDALKKSDQERQQGTTPHLHATHGPIPQVGGSQRAGRRRALWLISGGVVLVLSCLCLLFFKYHGNLNKISPKQPINMPPASTTFQSQNPRPHIKLSTTGQQEQDPTPDTVVAGDTKDIAPKTVVTKTQDELEPSAQTVITAGETSTVLPEPLVIELHDLSPALQAQIPELSFAGHTYAQNPDQRMIIINGKILREGKVIGPDMRLKEITWEGVIIEFRDTVFQVKTN